MYFLLHQRGSGMGSTSTDACLQLRQRTRVHMLTVWCIARKQLRRLTCILSLRMDHVSNSSYL